MWPGSADGSATKYRAAVRCNVSVKEEDMPIKIPADLPACSALESENIFVMTEDRAVAQDIRPLEIAIVNLMPTKIATEKMVIGFFW